MCIYTTSHWLLTDRRHPPPSVCVVIMLDAFVRSLSLPTPRCNFHIATATAGDAANLTSLQELLNVVRNRISAIEFFMQSSLLPMSCVRKKNKWNWVTLMYTFSSLVRSMDVVAVRHRLYCTVVEPRRSDGRGVLLYYVMLLCLHTWEGDLHWLNSINSVHHPPGLNEWMNNMKRQISLERVFLFFPFIFSHSSTL